MMPTLRDLFAMAVLPEVYRASIDLGQTEQRAIAAEALELADAMLESKNGEYIGTSRLCSMVRHKPTTEEEVKELQDYIRAWHPGARPHLAHLRAENEALTLQVKDLQRSLAAFKANATRRKRPFTAPGNGKTRQAANLQRKAAK